MTPTREETVIMEAIIAARKVQDYLWKELNLLNIPFDPKVWQRVFQKRVDKISEIIIDHPSSKVELRKRVLQQAALSIVAMMALDEENNKVNLHLCDSCFYHPATCSGNPTFGTGMGNDNVYACSCYQKKI
jgi:hypothetical protein